MSFATVFSRALLGVEALEVTVEAHLSAGLPGFAIVGLPETAVKESKERVRSAIINAGLEFPNRRLTVNLAPADVPKRSGRYDLAIAVTILAASGQIPEDRLQGLEFLGELALDGSLRPIRGALPAILQAKQAGRAILLPAANAAEIDLVSYEGAQGVASLQDLSRHLTDKEPLPPLPPFARPPELNARDDAAILLSSLRGQIAARRAIQVAAAGGHNLLMVGPPGCGKTLLAEAMLRLLPSLSEEEALEVASIHSVAGRSLRDADWFHRPLRAPHHSATAPSLVGGGNRAMPGEISLAHLGVLFLDELPEFPRSVLDSLREPLESGHITVTRANYRVSFPARFQLLAAMNPCPCGQATNPAQDCRCGPGNVMRYLNRLSGPLLDRLDLVVEMPALTQEELLGEEADATDWRAAKETVHRCRQRQLQRQGKLNQSLHSDELEQLCPLTRPLREILAEAMEAMSLSARAVHRLIRVARTLADLGDGKTIGREHLLEALSYRNRISTDSVGL